jgi:hypothetical protein
MSIRESNITKPNNGSSNVGQLSGPQPSTRDSFQFQSLLVTFWRVARHSSGIPARSPLDRLSTLRFNLDSKELGDYFPVPHNKSVGGTRDSSATAEMIRPHVHHLGLVTVAAADPVTFAWATLNDSQMVNKWPVKSVCFLMVIPLKSCLPY